MSLRASVIAVALVACTSPGASAGAAPRAKPEEVVIEGKAGKLQAYLWRPAGQGPFPVLVYNHGSEREPVVGTKGAIGPYFVAHGYAALFPYRRGSGASAGIHWRAVAEKGGDVHRGAIPALEAENEDVVTAIAWARAQPWAKKDEVTVGGCSFGGIHTLLIAEKGVPGVRAALDFAGGAMSWDGNPLLRARMLEAVGKAKVPVFFLQAENDFNTAPTAALSEAMDKAKLPNRKKIYPPFGTTNRSGHGGFCMYATDVWGKDVLHFVTSPR